MKKQITLIWRLLLGLGQGATEASSTFSSTAVSEEQSEATDDDE